MEPIKNAVSRLLATRLGQRFLDKKFIHYTWIAVFISLLNIFLLWLLIDIVNIPTIIASTLVVGITFVLRYVLFDSFKIL